MAKAAVRRSPMEHPRHQYPEATAELQVIARGCGLTESIKWGKPCFGLDGRNLVLIQRFNSYIALMFFHGALLDDPHRQLHRVGAMEAPRQLRFATVDEVVASRPAIEDFITQAKALDAVGARVPRRPVATLAVPAELQERLDAEPALGRAFRALTPGRQKTYLFEIAAAKQPATRRARVEKYAPRILAGKGLRD